MTFVSPYWLLLLLAWPLVPLLDRLARPKAATALPLPHLAARGLRPQPESLPWLSIHGLAFMFVAVALAGPQLPTQSGWESSPPLYIVAVPESPVAQQRYEDLVARIADRPIGVVAADRRGPQLLSPLTSAHWALPGIWPAADPAGIPAGGVGRALAVASAKAPSGAWLVVIGGRATPAWRTSLALAVARKQSVALIGESSPAMEHLFVYRIGLDDGDAITGLRLQLDGVSVDHRAPGPPLDLSRYCLAAALVTLSLGWVWRQRRWRTVSL